MPSPPFKMYIDDVNATRRIGNYTKNKFPLLSQIIKKAEAVCVYFTATQIVELINLLENSMAADSGLRIYFATYQHVDGDEENNKLIPPGADDQLTIIFAPTIWAGQGSDDDENHTDTGNYFVFDPTIQRFKELSDINIFLRWTAYYESLKRLPMSSHFGIDETKKMWYECDSILDLRSFIQNPSNEIEYVTIFFAAYHDSENASRKLHNGTTRKYSVHKKMTLIFLLATETEGFYTNLEFSHEKESLFYDKINKELQEILDTKSGDTGVPCPPAVC